MNECKEYIDYSENEEERLPFKCDECRRRFIDLKSLEKHQLTHLRQFFWQYFSN